MHPNTHTHTHYWFANWPLFLEGKKGPRKDPSKTGRYRFDKQKNFWKRLAFSSCKMSGPQYLQNRILEMYRKDLTGFCTWSVQIVSTAS